MACGVCDVARTDPVHNRFSMACNWCCARLIKRIKKLDLPSAGRTERCKANLADWVAYGIASEKEIRRIEAIDEVPYAPRETDVAKPSKKKK